MTMQPVTQPVHKMLAVKHGTKVLALLRAHVDGLTDHEIAHYLGMYLSSVNAARNSLYRQGFVDKTDIKRPSGRGGMAIVWIATNKPGQP